MSSPKAKIPRRSDRGDREKVPEKNAAPEKSERPDTATELTYDVLTIIFKNLNARDLCSAARVCRCWRDVANGEKKVRRCVPFTLLDNFDRRSCGPLQAKTLVRDFKVKPALSLAFMSPRGSGEIPLRKDGAECLCESMPMNTLYIRVANHGTVKDRHESHDSNDVAFLLLAKDDDINVDVVYYPVDRDQCQCTLTDYQPWTEKSRKRLEKMATSKKDIKCLLLLSSTETSGASILRCIARDNERTVSGSLVIDTLLCRNTKREKLCGQRVEWLVLSISGPSVQSWSVVLQDSIDTKDKIEDKLSKFKKRVQLKKKSVAFMFACEGRGEYKFYEANVESTIFKKLFPEVPLVGCSGDGEYGDSSIENLKDRSHQFSTVFTIVTYGQNSS